MRAKIPQALTALAVGTLCALSAGAQESGKLPLAAPVQPIIDTSPARELSLEEALRLARQNNRDLQAARARLKVSYADVERAISALLPRLSAQGRFTYNYPDVTFNIDQRGQAFAGLAQNAQIQDLAEGTGQTPRGVPYVTGPNSLDLVRRCNGAPSCKEYLDQALAAGGTAPDLEKLFSAANQNIVIVPKTQLEGGITLTLPLLVPPAYATLSAARKAYTGQERQFQATEAQLLQSVATAFFASAGTDELVAARRHAIEVSQKTLDNARARLEAGVVNRVEVTRAELALLQANQRLLEAEDSRGAAYRVLDTLILLRSPFKVRPPEEPPSEAGTDGDLVTEALRQRPEVPALESTIAAAHSQVVAQGLRWLPTLSAFGNIRFTNASGFANRYDYYAAGLQLDWQLFDGFERDAQRHVFAAQADEARLRLKQLRDTIGDEIQNARRQAFTRREGLKSAQRQVQLARETLDLVRIQHDAGTATQLDLLTAQDALMMAEVGLAQARFDLSLSDINLRRLLGRPLSR